jgi:hypothetical protein
MSVSEAEESEWSEQRIPELDIRFRGNEGILCLIVGVLSASVRESFWGAGYRWLSKR